MPKLINMSGGPKSVVVAVKDVNVMATVVAAIARDNNNIGTGQLGKRSTPDIFKTKY